MRPRDLPNKHNCCVISLSFCACFYFHCTFCVFVLYFSFCWISHTQIQTDSVCGCFFNGALAAKYFSRNARLVNHNCREESQTKEKKTDEENHLRQVLCEQKLNHSHRRKYFAVFNNTNLSVIMV